MGSIIHINPALCGRSGGEKYRKVRKRKVRGYIYLAAGGLIEKDQQSVKKRKVRGYMYVLIGG